MKNESYQVTRNRFICDHCERSFESDGHWAIVAVRQCEEECMAKAKDGLVRVFLPPPGKWDTMFQDSKWVFVERDSPQHVCAQQGHDEERSWEPYQDRVERRLDIVEHIIIENRIPREYEIVTCKRCGQSVHEFHGKYRDKK